MKGKVEARSKIRDKREMETYPTLKGQKQVDRQSEDERMKEEKKGNTDKIVKINRYRIRDNQEKR